MTPESKAQRLVSKNEMCRPPGEEIYFDGIISFEVYELDDFEDLKEQLRQFYEKIDTGRIQSAIESLSEDNFHGASSVTLPIISHSENDVEYLLNRGEEDLGEYIDHIEPRLIKPLPSMAILQTTIWLSDKANKDFKDIFEKKHGKGNSNLVKLPSKDKKKEIISLKRKIYSDVSEFYQENFPGIFSEKEADDRPYIPVISTIDQDFPYSEEKLEEWKKNKIQFFNCLGFSAHAKHVYSEQNYLISRNQHQDDFIGFTVIADLLNKEETTGSNKGDILTPLSHRDFSVLALLRYTEIREDVISELNRKLMSLVKPKNIFTNFLSLKKTYSIQKKYREDLASLKRFELEFERNLADRGYPPIESTGFDNLDNSNLLDRDISELIKKINDAHTETSEFYSESLKEVTRSRNTRSNIALTISSILLQILVVFLTAFSLYLTTK